MSQKIRNRIISGLSALALLSYTMMPSMQVFAEEMQSIQETPQILEAVQQNVDDEIPSVETSATLKLTNLSLKLTSGVNESHIFDNGDISGWKADKPNKGHEFTYHLAIAFSSNQSNFSEKGKVEAEAGDIQIHIPLHIIQDQSNTWADELSIWYPEENDPDIADSVKYVYRIDNDNNELILYNRVRFDEAQSIVIPFSYMTTKETWNYQDMEQFSCQVKVEIAVAQEDGTPKTIFLPDAGIQDGNYVCTDSISSYINTEAEIDSIQKSAESDNEGNKLTAWNPKWGIAPQNADQYLYTIWKIESRFKDVTQKYTFNLEDVYSGIIKHDGAEYGGLQGNPTVVGYQLSGQKNFSDNAIAEHQTASKRTDYVLVRYDKAIIDDLDIGTYQFENHITGIVNPEDRTSPEEDILADPITQADNKGYFLYIVENSPNEFTPPTEKYELSKYGIYAVNKRVNSSSDISSYQLQNLIIGDDINHLTYELQSSLNGSIRTLADGTVSFNEDTLLTIGDTVTLPDGSIRTIHNGTTFKVNNQFLTFQNAKSLKAEQLGTNTKIRKQDNSIVWIVDKNTEIPLNAGDTIIIGEIPYEVETSGFVKMGGSLTVKDGEESKQVFLKNHSIVNVDGEELTVISGSARCDLEIGDIIEPSSEISIENGYQIQNNTVITLTNEDVVTHQREQIHFMDNYSFLSGETANFITGTQQDAKDGYFGKQNVNYVFTDKDLKLENSPLINANDTDYNFTALSWKISSTDISYSSEKNALVYEKVSDYSQNVALENANIIKILITRDGENYSEYQTIDLKSVSAQNSSIQFPSGVTGWKFEFSSPYASHNISLFPKLTLKGSSENVQKALTEIKKTLEQDNYAIATLNNEASLTIQGGNDVSSIFDDDYEIRKNNHDFIASVIREYKISKSIAPENDAVNVNKGQQYVSVRWNTKISETIRKNTDTEPKRQESGIFYDYLPLGSTLLTTDSRGNNVAVYCGDISEEYRLQYGTDYTYTTEWDTTQNRQKLLVKIIAPSEMGIYSVVYSTKHYYWDINDYGRTVRNSVAYQTGNEDIANGRISDGGGTTIQDNAILAYWIPKTNDKKYLYEQAYYTINSLIPSSAGISKKVATPSTDGYVEHGILNVEKDMDSEPYSYQVRWANSTLERAKNIIVLDSLENYQNGWNASSEDNVSEWHGTLTGFDFSSLENNDVNVKIYLTTEDKSQLDFDSIYSKEHSILETDLVNGKTGIDWVEWNQKTDETSNINLDEVTAFAVDLRKKTDDTDYILGYNQSFNFVVHMKAPSLQVFNADEEQQGHIENSGEKRYNEDHDPETNNSIFRSYDSIFDNMYTFGERSEIKIDNSKVTEIIVKQKSVDEDGLVKNIESFLIPCNLIQKVSYQKNVWNETTETYEIQDIARWENGSSEPIPFQTGDKITYLDNDGIEQILTIGVTDEMNWISSAPEYGFYAHTIVTYRAVGKPQNCQSQQRRYFPIDSKYSFPSSGDIMVRYRK